MNHSHEKSHLKFFIFFYLIEICYSRIRVCVYVSRAFTIHHYEYTTRSTDFIHSAKIKLKRIHQPKFTDFKAKQIKKNAFNDFNEISHVMRKNGKHSQLSRLTVCDHCFCCHSPRSFCHYSYSLSCALFSIYTNTNTI